MLYPSAATRRDSYLYSSIPWAFCTTGIFTRIPYKYQVISIIAVYPGLIGELVTMVTIGNIMSHPNYLIKIYRNGHLTFIMYHRELLFYFKISESLST